LVKRFVADGSLSDPEIRALRKNAIDRIGSVLHAELLLMAAMRNPVNVALMQAHVGGSLILAVSNILQADKDYVINFDREVVDLSAAAMSLVGALAGVSGQTLIEALTSMNDEAEKIILKIGGKQFADQATSLVDSAKLTNPVILLPEVLAAMKSAAADNTPGDQIMAGMAYVVAKRFGHPTAPQLLNGTLKVDAMIPSVYKRITGSPSAMYMASTDEDVRKANVLYLPTSLDIVNITDRALIIHELTHAEEDLKHLPRRTSIPWNLRAGLIRRKPCT